MVFAEQGGRTFPETKTFDEILGKRTDRNFIRHNPEAGFSRMKKPEKKKKKKKKKERVLKKPEKKNW